MQLINIVLTSEPKHSTSLATKKNVNSIPAETRTRGHLLLGMCCTGLCSLLIGADVRNQTLQLKEGYQAGMFIGAPAARGIAPPHLHTQGLSKQIPITQKHTYSLDSQEKAGLLPFGPGTQYHKPPHSGAGALTPAGPGLGSLGGRLAPFLRMYFSLWRAVLRSPRQQAQSQVVLVLFPARTSCRQHSSCLQRS